MPRDGGERPEYTEIRGSHRPDRNHELNRKETYHIVDRGKTWNRSLYSSQESNRKPKIKIAVNHYSKSD